MRALVAAFLALTLAHCHVAPPPAPVSPARSSRVILISYDGVGADDVEQMLRTNVFGNSGLRRLIAEGMYARVIPVNPTLTASAHISIASGASPERTGIVSNTFHLRGSPRNESASGFEVPIETDTIWEAARRQGKRVGVITFPGVDGKGPRRTADWGLAYSHPVKQSRLVHFQRKDFRSSSTSLPSYSPPMQVQLSWDFPLSGTTVSQNLDLVVLDSTNDSRENYDSVRVRTDNRDVPLDQNRWFATSTWVEQGEGGRLYGSWSKILELRPDLSRVNVYLGPISSTEGYPESYRLMIDEQVGFWPGPPEDKLTEDWLERREGVDPDTFIQQLQRLSEFLTRATTLSVQTMPWDLILAYQPTVDESQHDYRIVNDRQQWSTPQNRAAGRRVFEAAYLAVDASVAKISDLIRGEAALLVTGDHGLAPVDTSVRVNRLLADWGYAELSGNKLSPATPWAAFTSGTLAHIYGFDSPSPFQIEQLAERLRGVRAPDGEIVFERVEVRTSAHHPNSGDIVAYGYPRFAMSSSLEAGPMVKTRFFGQHGGLNHHREYHTIVVAAGSRVAKLKRTVIDQTEIAGLVARLLGIEPPAHGQG